MESESSRRWDVYAYGMSLWSTIHKLKDGYPEEDTYGEILDTHQVPGGEAANGALILSRFGLSVRLDGASLGRATREALVSFYEANGVDCSLMSYREDFEGWKDIVLCGGGTRTVLGWFQQLYGGDNILWSEPNAEAIAEARVALIDPSFPGASEKAAQLCASSGTPFVSLDSGYDSPLATEAAAIVCSNEFLSSRYPDVNRDELLDRYAKQCKGLVVFTLGGKPIRFARGKERGELEPYAIDVLDTLAAGDSFRAGVAYGIAQGLEPEKVVRYGAATAALVCQRFPSIHPIPTLAEVEALVKGTV